MPSKIALTLGAAILFLSSHALAADCTSNSCSGNLNLLYPSTAGDTVFIQPSGSINALQCTTVNSKYVTLKLDTDLKRATWQLLLASFLSGKSVFLKLNTSGTCEIQYVTVGQ
jgi:hypothetical protein